MENKNLSALDANYQKINKPDSPGIQFPPPVLHLLIIVAAIVAQKWIPLNHLFFKNPFLPPIGIGFFLVAVIIIIRSMGQFIRTKNNIIPNKPAESLQTSGIYHFTRNPMYVGLTLVYLGFTCFFGNWWNLIFLPVLLLLVQEIVIKKEEEYLTRRFGEHYIQYKRNVRRWV